MKKTFPFHVPGRNNARVLDAIKHEVRKYVNRERGKALPEGFATWTFECRVGADENSAESKALKEVSATIDAVAASGSPAVYVEILAVPAGGSATDRPD